MFDNPQGSDVVTEETSADVENVSTDETVEPQELFYGSEEVEAANEVDEASNEVDGEAVTAEPETEVESTTFTFKADGEEHTLSEDKMKEYASKGIRFYNAMEEVASEKKAFEAEKQEFEAKQATAIQKLASFLEEQPELNIDDLGAEEFIKQKEQREAAQAALDEAKGQQTAKQQAAAQQYITQEINLLSERMGDRWSDAEAMNSDIQSAKEWMKKEFGATDDELKDAVNHKFWHMGIKGAQLQAKLDQLEAKKDKISKEVKKAPKTVKSGNKPADSRSIEDKFYG